METIKLNSHVVTDGILQITMPANLKNTAVEVVLVVQPLLSEETKSKYNAWGKLTTKESIQQAIEQMRKLQQQVALSPNFIREMIDEGRRF
ncbi:MULTISPECIES: hypothetical protein [Planktothricoides]|uniref:Uncharacterized protein n=2 Tax=Planktothricoides raciborskii TaxID=132608 RepID=A0AAU8JHC3_9CYAN|nr:MULTISPECIES: hypothetical protein [Planktothricoides]KOR35165.1 hypothetical protein AM228_19810 [Planktothricoides sp. SR001]MBD2546159.1 hypothetical protein [Planktothricoides raciborskii FACHB-1370]MBD2583843.1 hypothetical protein [Planktothricoides raciborskii FACHB-1261]